MKAFEFMYGDTWYKYERGYLHRKDVYGVYVLHCPVASELIAILDSFDATQLRIVMGAIIHGYVHGKDAGRNSQIKEFKRLFNID